MPVRNPRINIKDCLEYGKSHGHDFVSEMFIALRAALKEFTVYFPTASDFEATAIVKQFLLQIHNQISKHIKCNKSENIFIADDSITVQAKSINFIIFRFRFLFSLEAKEISELRLTHYYVQCDDYSRHASIISFACDGWMKK